MKYALAGRKCPWWRRGGQAGCDEGVEITVEPLGGLADLCKARDVACQSAIKHKPFPHTCGEGWKKDGLTLGKVLEDLAKAGRLLGRHSRSN